MTMTTPTPEELAEPWKTFVARINARSGAKADSAAAMQGVKPRPPTPTKDKTMTKPTPEEEERRIEEYLASTKAQWQAKADNAAAIIAAGGLASNMTLRDHFAGQALAGLAQDESVTTERAGAIAYEMADAMLEARKATGEGEA
jgi:hypothetical protein